MSNTIDIENIINKISTGFSLKNCIFIFDDLERTSCNVNDILGYINNFIEMEKVVIHPMYIYYPFMPASQSFRIKK